MTSNPVSWWVSYGPTTTSSCRHVLVLSSAQRTRTSTAAESSTGISAGTELGADNRCFSSFGSCIVKWKSNLDPFSTCITIIHLFTCQKWLWISSAVNPLTPLCLDVLHLDCGGGGGNLEEFPFAQWWLSWLLSVHLGGVFKMVSVAIFLCWLISHEAFQQRSIPNFDPSFHAHRIHLQTILMVFNW